MVFSCCTVLDRCGWGCTVILAGPAHHIPFSARLFLTRARSLRCATTRSRQRPLLAGGRGVWARGLELHQDVSEQAPGHGMGAWRWGAGAHSCCWRFLWSLA